MIIEDDEDSALVIQTTLDLSGAQTWVVSSAEQALELLDETIPDLMLVDLALPGMDGWSLIHHIRSEARFIRIPAIVMSAYLTRTVAQKALASGFTGCLPKPIDTTSLIEQLTHILQNSTPLSN